MTRSDGTAARGPVVIFGREPAWWLALVAVLVSTVSAFLVNVTMDQQAAINATAAALSGVVTAVIVKDGKILAALTGLTQAVILLAVTYGLDLPAEKQAILLTLVTVAVQGYLRTQVTAPVQPPPQVVDGTATVRTTTLL